MNAQWILLGMGVLFLGAVLWRRSRRGHLDSATRIWLRVAVIFVLVSAWLFWHSVPAGPLN